MLHLVQYVPEFLKAFPYVHPAVSRKGDRTRQSATVQALQLPVLSALHQLHDLLRMSLAQIFKGSQKAKGFEGRSDKQEKRGASRKERKNEILKQEILGDKLKEGETEQGRSGGICEKEQTDAHRQQDNLMKERKKVALRSAMLSLIIGLGKLSFAECFLGSEVGGKWMKTGADGQKEPASLSTTFCALKGWTSQLSSEERQRRKPKEARSDVARKGWQLI